VCEILQPRNFFAPTRELISGWHGGWLGADFAGGHRAQRAVGEAEEQVALGVEALGAPIGGLVLSPAFLISLVVVAAGQTVLSHTPLGRHWIAIGANREAALVSGVQVDRPRLLAHALLGALTGLAAIFNCSRLGSADPNAGVGFELSAIAAVVVGGTSLMGGRGSVVKSFLGVLVIATLEAGLVQIGASEPMKRVVTGMVIVAAVLADVVRRAPRPGRDLAERIDALLTHRLWGPLVFAVVMLAVFSSIFWLAAPLMDLIFGTYHHPGHEPEAFGLDTPISRGFLGQLMHPFRRVPPP
jgi:ABC-type uncharacterized transport system permease subunit